MIASNSIQDSSDMLLDQILDIIRDNFKSINIGKIDQDIS